MLWFKANDSELEKCYSTQMFFEPIYREIYSSISQFDVNLNKLTEEKNKIKDFKQILAKPLAKIRLFCFCFQETPKHNTKYIDCNGVDIYKFVQQIWTKSFANGHKRDGHILQYQSSQLDKLFWSGI